MIETDKTKDSDLLAVMIYRSFVAPETLPTPPDMTFISFRDALDLYARTWNREVQAAPKIFLVSGGNGPGELKGGAGGSAYPPPPPVSDPDTEPDCGDSCPVELT